MPRTSTKPASLRQKHESHVLDDYVGHWLRRAHHYAGANLSSYIRAHDLTPAQLAALLRLHEVERASQNELGRGVAMEPANIHKIVNRLLDRGLVLAEKDETDGRKTLIHLSSKGRELVEKVEPLHWQANEDTLGVLTSGERSLLLRLLRRLCRMD